MRSARNPAFLAPEDIDVQTRSRSNTKNSYSSQRLSKMSDGPGAQLTDERTPDRFIDEITPAPPQMRRSVQFHPITPRPKKPSVQKTDSDIDYTLPQAEKSSPKFFNSTIETWLNSQPRMSERETYSSNSCERFVRVFNKAAKFALRGIIEKNECPAKQI